MPDKLRGGADDNPEPRPPSRGRPTRYNPRPSLEEVIEELKRRLAEQKERIRNIGVRQPLETYARKVLREADKIAQQTSLPRTEGNRVIFGEVPEEVNAILEEMKKDVRDKLAEIEEEPSGMGKKRSVSISKKDFVKEHKNLLGVLKRGKKSELLAEAKDQSKELSKVLGGNVMTSSSQPPPPPPPRKGKKCDTPANQEQKKLIAEYKKVKRQRDMMESNRVATIETMGEDEWVGSIGEQRLNALNARLELLENALMNANQLKEGCGRGGGPIPDRNTLQQLATQSYQTNPAKRIGQLELVRTTPTLKFYKDNGNTIVVAIRGTQPTDIDDVKADGLLAIGQLERSDRYKEDLNAIQQFQTRYSPSQYDYYGVGHSLGGAIMDMFLKRGLLKNGVSYNPAVQPQDFKNTSLGNQRVYSKSDPLYAIMGRNLAKKPDVREARKKSWWEKAVSAVPLLGTAMKGYDLYQSHMLDQFQGGARPSTKFDKQLRKAGIEPSSYLKEAQRRAKNAGLPYKVLGFADDGDHKLAIPNADGKMIKFGKVGYGDHLIWSHLEKAQKVPLGTADAKRNTFQKSHSKIKGDWKSDPFSPNNLALKVLW